MAEDPGVWLGHYLRICKSNDWTTNAQKLAHVSTSLVGEAEAWYEINAEWIEDDTTTWGDFADQFTSRFRPSDFAEELEERLRTPTQKEGESVRAYADRYKRLRAQVGADAPSANICRNYWISGLHAPIKREVLLTEPMSLDAAILRAMTAEKVDRKMNRDEQHVKSGKRPLPKIKSKSADVAGAEDMADDAAGLTSAGSTPSNSDKNAANTQGFEEFHKAMGPDIAEDVDVDELVRRFTAWQLYSQVYTTGQSQGRYSQVDCREEEPAAAGQRKEPIMYILQRGRT